MPYKDSVKKREYDKQWRRENPEKFQVYQKSYRTENPEKCRRAKRQCRAKNYEILCKLKEKPCTDCGELFPPFCMDFDHVRGTKVASISRLLSDNKFDKVLEEIEKCELVCANCHRIRTVGRTVGILP